MIVNLIGNLGADAKILETQNGDTLQFSVAESKKVKKDGEIYEKVVWVSCFYKPKEVANLKPYLKKGTKVSVLGDLSASIANTEQGIRLNLTVNVIRLELVSVPQEENKVREVAEQVNEETGEVICNNEELPF